MIEFVVVMEPSVRNQRAAGRPKPLFGLGIQRRSESVDVRSKPPSCATAYRQHGDIESEKTSPTREARSLRDALHAVERRIATLHQIRVELAGGLAEIDHLKDGTRPHRAHAVLLQTARRPSARRANGSAE